jgi:hypothetical protein
VQDGGTTPRIGPDAGIVSRPDGQLPPSTDCADAARWIYLVDASSELLRFQPDSGVITSIGRISCPAGGAMPFSMAVDRRANAYVLHGDHRIYQVSTVDASCTSTAFAPDQHGLELFGMGFVSEAEGSTEESLYIAGGPELAIGTGSSTLARVALPGWTVSAPIGTLRGSPELTGNGEGELWAFMPDATPMTVGHIDRASARLVRQVDVSEIDPDGLGIAASWAFAFWGGRYYVFYMGLLDGSTGIYRVTPESGEVETVRVETGYRIVGAGVSTCAPTELI